MSYKVKTILQGICSLLIIIAIAFGVFFSLAFINRSLNLSDTENFVYRKANGETIQDIILYGEYYIIDKRTDVVYVWLVGSGSRGISPLYNADGTLVTASSLGITY
jgi:hypothetical protein